MDFGSMPLFAAMTRRLAWLGKRQQVLAQNVANANTPGYKAQDLKDPSFAALLGKDSAARMPMAATRAGHIAPQGAASAAFKPVDDKIEHVSLSGNSVSLEDQMMKVSKTAMDYQLTVNLYRKHMAMIRTALGRPGG